MATTRRELIVVTFVLSGVALALLITSLATKMWVISDLQPTTASGFTQMGSVRYGLFAGSLEIGILSNQKVVTDITLACLLSENVCAWSCLDTSEQREQEMYDLLQKDNPELETCKSTTVTTMLRLQEVDSLMRVDANTTLTDLVPDKQFVNAGLWVSTLFFLILALLVTSIATVLGVLNAASNPSSTALAPEGMFYWNGTAACMDLICLVLWGGQFGSTLSDNVAVATVIVGNFTSGGLASLGYSYWLVLVAMLSSVANVGVLALREYLIRRTPPPPTFRPQDPDVDGVIFLF